MNMMHDCVVCLAQHPTAKVTIIDTSWVCHDCTCHLFLAAVHSEDSYPPEWGSKRLRPEEFRSIVPPELAKQFTEKEKEYLTPPAERVYCMNVNVNDYLTDDGEDVRCGKFIGRIDADWEDDLARGIIPRKRCKACNTSHCMICAEKYVPLHKCEKFPQTDEEKAFAGLVKGKDYQICPNTSCHRKIELQDGCNHVVCKCSQSLCFVCGEVAAYNHWDKPKREGGCPRYNHPSMPNAIWQREAAVPNGFMQQMRRFQFLDRRNAVAGHQDLNQEALPLFGPEAANHLVDADARRRARRERVQEQRRAVFVEQETQREIRRLEARLAEQQRALEELEGRPRPGITARPNSLVADAPVPLPIHHENVAPRRPWQPPFAQVEQEDQQQNLAPRRPWQPPFAQFDEEAQQQHELELLEILRARQPDRPWRPWHATTLRERSEPDIGRRNAGREQDRVNPVPAAVRARRLFFGEGSVGAAPPPRVTSPVDEDVSAWGGLPRMNDRSVTVQALDSIRNIRRTGDGWPESQNDRLSTSSMWEESDAFTIRTGTEQRRRAPTNLPHPPPNPALLGYPSPPPGFGSHRRNMARHVNPAPLARTTTSSMETENGTTRGTTIDGSDRLQMFQQAAARYSQRTRRAGEFHTQQQTARTVPWHVDGHDDIWAPVNERAGRNLMAQMNQVETATLARPFQDEELIDLTAEDSDDEMDESD